MICIFTQSEIKVLNLSILITKRLISAKKKAFSSFIMRISIIATTISVAAMIVSLSFINGFQKIISEKIFGFWGHIRVQHYEPVKSNIAEESPIRRNDTAEFMIKNAPNVNSLSTFATKSAILNANGTIEGILMKGVSKEYPFKKLTRFLTKGQWPSYKDSGYAEDIVLSEYTANQLGTDVGRNLLIYFIQSDGSAPRTRKLKVSGLYKTGIDVYDKVYAIGDIRLIQKLNGWEESEVGGYEIDVTDPLKMDETSYQLYDQLPSGWNALTMKELSPEIFDWLNLQNTNKYILLTVMTIVALINLITCLIILLLERTGMIALLKALGARDIQIQTTFIAYGSWIAGIGIAAGTLLGLFVCYLQLYTGFIRLNEEAYYVHIAPVDIRLGDVIIVTFGTALISVLILFIPSIISKRINPSKALRFK
jgi:lipoprotein-releasing system permease protein